MDDRTIASAAAELLSMRRDRRIVADLPEALRPSDLGEAYAIQSVVVDGLLPAGANRIGYKAACTNPIARPVYGRLMSHTTSPNGAALPADRFTRRVIEAEFAFRVGRDVDARRGGHDAESIADHLDRAVPGIEIVDHRFVSWALGALPVAADNAIHGWWVRGEPFDAWRELDLAAVPVRVERGGQPVTEGSGAAVLGHPLNVMAWLADELPRYGGRLRAGDWVTTGVATDVFEADAGDELVASFGPMGTVRMSFV